MPVSPPAFTAQQLAHHVKIAGDRVVKTVIIELDGKMAMLVMPATWRIRWDRLTHILDTDFVDLADEQEFQDRFPSAKWAPCHRSATCLICPCIALRL